MTADSKKENFDSRDQTKTSKVLKNLMPLFRGVCT